MKEKMQLLENNQLDSLSESELMDIGGGDKIGGPVKGVIEVLKWIFIGDIYKD